MNAVDKRSGDPGKPAARQPEHKSVRTVSRTVRRLLVERELTLREFDALSGQAVGYGSQVLNGHVRLTFHHVFNWLDALEESPVEFFRELTEMLERQGKRAERQPDVEFDVPQLLSLPRDRQLSKLHSEPSLHTAEVAMQLRKASDEQRFAAPKLTLHLARLAVNAARPASIRRGAIGGGPAERDELAECLATLGNAHRIVGDTKPAKSFLKEAEGVAQLGSGDELLQSKIELLLAVLLSDQGDLEQALLINERCLETYRRLGESQLVTRALLSVAQIHLRSGRPNEALDSAVRCLEKIVPPDEPLIAHSALLLIATAKLDLGEAREAYDRARKLQLACCKPSERTFRIRGEWVESRALLAMGAWDEGVDGLNRVRGKLVEVGALGAAAHAHLELALAYAGASQWEKAGTLARQAFGSLSAAGLEGQALLALRTVANAAKERKLTSEVLRQAMATVTASS